MIFPLAEIDWLSIGQTFGVAALCLAGLSLAIWKASNWFAVTIVKPLFDSHMELIRNLDEQATRQTTALEKISESFASQNATLAIIKGSQERIILCHEILAESHRRLAESQQQGIALEKACIEQLVILNAESKRQTAELVKQTQEISNQLRNLAEHRGKM